MQNAQLQTRPSPSDIATNYDGGKWLCLLRLLVDSGLPISPGRRGENEKKVVRHDDICVSDLSVYMFIYTHIYYTVVLLTGKRAVPELEVHIPGYALTFPGTSLLYCRAVHEHMSLLELMRDFGT